MTPTELCRGWRYDHRCIRDSGHEGNCMIAGKTVDPCVTGVKPFVWADVDPSQFTGFTEPLVAPPVEGGQ